MCPFSEFQGLRGVLPISSLKTDDSLWDGHPFVAEFSPQSLEILCFHSSQILTSEKSPPTTRKSGGNTSSPGIGPDCGVLPWGGLFWGRVDKDKYGCATEFCFGFFVVWMVLSYVFFNVFCFDAFILCWKRFKMNLWTNRNLAVFLLPWRVFTQWNRIALAWLHFAVETARHFRWNEICSMRKQRAKVWGPC